MSNHSNKTSVSFESSEESKGSLETITRLSAVVLVLVEAGCAGPPEIVLHLAGNRSGGKTWLMLAAYEKWFNHTVVPWAWSKFGIETYPPAWLMDYESWSWMVEITEGKHPDPTEAFVRCIEALTEVVKETTK